MKNYKIVLFLGAMFVSTQAFSNHMHHQHNCVQERWELLKQEVKTTSGCELTRELALKDQSIYYPRIGHTMLVNYWEGRYEKSQHVIQSYRHEYIDICHGRLIYSGNEVYESDISKAYDLKNPNLDLNIKESYKLAAMTDEEAKAAYGLLKNECEL